MTLSSGTPPRPPIVGLAAVLLLVATGCGDDASREVTAAATTTAPTTTAPTTTVAPSSTAAPNTTHRVTTTAAPTVTADADLLAPTPREGTRTTLDADVTAAVVEVLDPGAEPRRELRFDYPDAVTAVASFDASFDVTTGGEVFSIDQTLTARVRNRGRTPEGFAVETEFQRVDLTGDGLEAGAVDPLRDAFEGTFHDEVVTPDGRVVEASYDLPEDAAGIGDPSLLRAFGGVATPLPTGPVGVGARWRTVDERSVDGVATVTTAETTLTGFDGECIAFETTTVVEVTGVADGQGSGTGSGTTCLTSLNARSTSTQSVEQRITIDGEIVEQRLVVGGDLVVEEK